MGVSLEPVVWIVRGGPEHEKFGDPFDTSVIAIKADEESVRMVGLTGKISTALYKAAARAFAELGITIFSRTRHKPQR